MRYEFWLGCRYLFAKRRERFISAIAVLSIGGVTLGVAALLVVLAVMSGFDHDITDKLINTNAQIIIDTPTGVADFEQVIQTVSSIEHVVGATPFVTGQAVVRLSDRAFGILVRGVDVAREQKVNRLKDYIVFGKLPENDQQIAIGNELASTLKLGPGDTLKLISPADGKTYELEVSGIFRSGMYEVDATLGVVSLTKAQQLYHLNQTVTGIGLRLDQVSLAPKLALIIEQKLGGEYHAVTWQELNPALFGALRVEKTVMFVILSLIILVAALNIMSMLIMVVMEKTKDIGTLRAIGATRGSVATVFFSQGIMIGLIGISLGLAGGLFLTRNLNNISNWLERVFGWSLFPPSIYYLDHIPARTEMSDLVAVAIAAFCMTALAGTYAAIRAASLEPVEALRYE